jgi:hypothetical protein
MWTSRQVSLFSLIAFALFLPVSQPGIARASEWSPGPDELWQEPGKGARPAAAAAGSSGSAGEGGATMRAGSAATRRSVAPEEPAGWVRWLSSLARGGGGA